MARALRVQGQIDILHDAIAADVLLFAHRRDRTSVTSQLKEDIEHMTESLARLETLPLPGEITQAVTRIRPDLQRYMAASSHLIDQVQRDLPVDDADIHTIEAQWQALEAPLAEISRQLMGIANQMRDNGRSAFWTALGFLALSSVIAIAAMTSVLFRSSRALLTANIELLTARQAADLAANTKSDFLAAMSHEIRTPLTGVLGMADLLGAEDLTRRQKGYVDAIRASGRHLMSIINDILDFSRIETGKLELEHIDFSLPEWLERLRSLTCPLAVDRGLELRFELSEHSPPVLRGDPNRLTQVLLNLVGNAIKFTEQGSVTLHVAHRPETENGLRFRFEVRDTGIGIAPDQQAELFTAFTQADRSTARRFGGSGLGLAISKRLVNAMGGEIGVNSLPGVGSVFWIEVPFALGDPADLMKAAHVHFPQASPCRILVAEDVAINRDLLKDVLTRQGHRVIFAENGAEALAWVGKETFDLILMDVQMPVMDGIEATRRIRKLDAPARSIPILALTANVMAKEREQYLAAGMTECLMKPIDWVQLAAAIARHCGKGLAVASSGEPFDDEADDVPLVDHQILDRFSPYMSGEQLASWLSRGIEDAERFYEHMAVPSANPDERTRKAHSLKGSAGTFGFARISRIAAEIEATVPSARESEHLMADLDGAIGATRAELRQSGLIQD
ncbi:response regulator [Microvirga sp. BT689]|uniref:sensor histidine kinase n=1 Tax=Microvirga arvi TaxID=2778731 RepID=UPI001951363F|nr:sensor histidine kinase [Microvirga arvi]MBM6579394.1 response regulator [Microvirga arvi]